MACMAVPGAQLASAVGSALNPKQGNTILEKWGPILVVVVWLAMTLAIFFDVAPTTDATTTAYGVVSAAAGIYVRHMGH